VKKKGVGERGDTEFAMSGNMKNPVGGGWKREGGFGFYVEVGSIRKLDQTGRQESLSPPRNSFPSSPAA